MSAGHVEIVLVYRCGLWPEDCAGDERGCQDPFCREAREATGATLEGMRVELTHAQFLAQFGRCPDSCRPAVQLALVP